MTLFRLKGSARRRTMLSTSGLITGGTYDGWRYAFERFEVDHRGILHLVVTGGDPAWPFPQTLKLARNDFNTLVGVTGERAPVIDAALLIPEAIRSARHLSTCQMDRLRRVNARYLSPADPPPAPDGDLWEV